MDRFRDLVADAIIVPCRSFLKHGVDDPALDKISDVPTPHYRFVGTLEDVARLMPIDRNYPMIDSNRTLIADALIAGRSVTLTPYYDRPYAYATVTERVLN